MKEAMLYTKEDGSKVHCRLCRHGCRIPEGGHGICNVRVNDGGTLRTLFYGRPISMAVDPIEKKPFFHFRPGSTAFSIACPGCNFQCDFCQTWEISQYRRTGLPGTPSAEPWRTGFDLGASLQEVQPEEVVANAVARRCASISYTYTEPTVFFEYAHDIAQLAKAKGLANNFVTNGYMTREALDAARPWLDAANVDLKAFRKETYRKVMKGELDGVLDSIRTMKELGIWIEVTTLIVPGMNDDPAELRDIATFLVETGRNIPWHISRFTPRYKREDGKPTPEKTLRAALEIGRTAGLRYVYLGNVPGDPAEHTRCYECGETLIERTGFVVRSNRITERGECPKCRAKIDGVGMGKK